MYPEAHEYLDLLRHLQKARVRRVLLQEFLLAVDAIDNPDLGETDRGPGGRMLQWLLQLQ